MNFLAGVPKAMAAGPLDSAEAVWDGGHLAIPVQPRPGEGMAEVIVRATAENSYGRCARILDAVKVRASLSSGSAERYQGRVNALATLLGVPGGSKSLEPILYLPIPDRAGWHSFFGTQIRDGYQDAKRRRVSPRALRRSPHLRAIWSVRLLGFDPLTKETLLERCPVCGHSFGWARTRGVVFCDQCLYTDGRGCEYGAVDLRDHPQPLVDERYWSRLDFLTGLIDPDPDVRASFAPDLPEPLRGFERGQIFEFAIALASAFDARSDQKWGYLPRHTRKESYKRFTPDVLATAAMAVLDWPETFNAAVEEVREVEANRPGHFGTHKAFGPLASLAVDHFIHADLTTMVRQELGRHLVSSRTVIPRMRSDLEYEKNADLAPLDLARRSLGISKNRIARLVKRQRVSSIRTADSQKASVLVSVSEIATLVASETSRVPIDKAAARLDLPSLAIVSLCERGLLQYQSVQQGMSTSSGVNRSSLDEFVQRVDGTALETEPPAQAIPLLSAAVCLGLPAVNPWPEIFGAILKGTLQVWRTRAGPVASSMSIRLDDAKGLIGTAKPWFNRSVDPVVSHQDASRLLGTNVATIYVLLNTGKIPRRPLLSQLQSFARDNILTSEAANILSSSGLVLHPRGVARLLQDRGVRPVTSSNRLNRLAWPRAQAEAAIAEACAVWSAKDVSDRGSPKKWLPNLLSPATSTSRLRASGMIGIPGVALRSISSIGQLVIVKFAGRDEFGVEMASLNDLATSIEARLLPPTSLRGALSLALAAKIAGSPAVNPWPALLAGILDGSLHAMRTSPTGHMSNCIAVESIALERRLPSLKWTTAEEMMRVPQVDAARLLGTSPMIIGALIRSKFLPEKHTLADIQVFCRNYALTLELSHRFRMNGLQLDSRLSSELLRSAGVMPEAVLHCNGALVWRRTEAERVLVERCKARL